MKTRVSGVCKDCFCNVYGVSPSHVDMVVRELKTGTTNSSQVFSDHSTSPLAVLAGLRRVAKSFGIHLTKRQVAAAKLPNSPVVLSAYGWMLDHFKLVGDYQPNLGGEIHLEPRHIVEITESTRWTCSTLRYLQFLLINLHRFGPTACHM